MRINYATYFMHHLIESPAYELIPIIEELHCTAIDPYTFAKEIEYYITENVSAEKMKGESQYFSKLINSIEGRKYLSKTTILADVKWYWIADYYIRKYKNHDDVKFSRVLSSFYYDKHIKDPILHDSGRYHFEYEVSPSKFYWISLKNTSDLLLK